MSRIKPRTRTPDLEVSTTDGAQWNLSRQKPGHFTLIVAYRGLHCPICKTYLRDLDRNVEEFRKRGVEVIALSSDDADRARRTREEWGLGHLTVGYGLGIDKAREWGLYVSKGRGTTSAGVDEPAEFNEPGLFLVKPDQILYAASINTMPFARPSFKELLGAIDFVVANDYPARGEV